MLESILYMTPDEIRQAEKRGRKHKISSQKKRYYARTKKLTPEQRKERKDRTLWFRLHKIFTRHEYVSYDDLPEALQASVAPFPDFIIDRAGRIASIR